MFRPKPPRRSTSVDPEELALAALVFITEDQTRLMRFLADSGLQPGELAAAAAHPGMQGAVLDYLVSDESLLLVFADHAPLIPHPSSRRARCWHTVVAEREPGVSDVADIHR